MNLLNYLLGRKEPEPSNRIGDSEPIARIEPAVKPGNVCDLRPGGVTFVDPEYDYDGELDLWRKRK